MTDLYRRFPKVGFTFKFIFWFFIASIRSRLKTSQCQRQSLRMVFKVDLCPALNLCWKQLCLLHPPVTHLPRQRDASSAGVTFLTPKSQEMQTQDLEARLALARSIKAVIEKNYKPPTGPETLVVSMTRTLFCSQIEALKALVSACCNASIK